MLRIEATATHCNVNMELIDNMQDTVNIKHDSFLTKA